MTLTEIWKLNSTCNISTETVKLRIWMTLKETRQGVFVESRTFKCEEERNDQILQNEQVFGNVCKKRESKYCWVLTKHHHKVKGEQVITLQMAQQLKTKEMNIVTEKLFCQQCNAKFLLEATHCIDYKDKSPVCYRYW